MKNVTLSGLKRCSIDVPTCGVCVTARQQWPLTACVFALKSNRSTEHKRKSYEGSHSGREGVPFHHFFAHASAYCLICTRTGFSNRATIIIKNIHTYSSNPIRVLLSRLIGPNPDMSNSIETAIAIAIFSTIAIGIAIAKVIFQLLLLLLILLREFSNYCYCYWYC